MMSFSKVCAVCFGLFAAVSLPALPALASPPKRVASRYSFPVQNFAGYGRQFGWQDAARKNFNDGIDLLAAGGSYVHAWSTGTVKEISYSPKCGWRIIITYKSWATEYCNIGGGVTVPVGRQVQAGDVVAKLDDTPANTLATLHWSLSYKGKPINPSAIIHVMQIAQQD